MSGSGGAKRRPISAHRRSLRARFDDAADVSGRKRRSVESCRIRIERDPGRAGGPQVEGRSSSDHGNRTEGQPKVEKVWDPWAEDGPVFGDRGRRHALSRHPGTPPCGNLAVQGPEGLAASAPREPDASTSDAGRAPVALPDALVPLKMPLRVELELGFSGRWTFGLVERASRTGFEARLGGRSVGTRDFVLAGRRVKVLVTPHGTGGPFVLPARVLWVDPPPGPDGPMRAQLAIATSDPAALGRWAEVVEKARG
ncbi:MAG: hypothetical protein ACYTKD_07090 [Planctomycetota bacterium]